MNAIELRNVTKTYPLFKVDNVSLDVKKGYITGLIGPNGAGKSTLIKMITGLIQPDKGSSRHWAVRCPIRKLISSNALALCPMNVFTMSI